MDMPSLEDLAFPPPGVQVICVAIIVLTLIMAAVMVVSHRDDD